MGRRSKQELEIAEKIIKSFLEDTNNNPHKAWDEYIKFYLEGGIPLPVYIKGIKDFIKVSERYQTEHEYKKQLEQQKKDNKQLEVDYIDKIKNLSLESDYPRVRDEYYKSSNQEHKMALVNLMFCIKDTNKNDWQFTANEIRIFKDLGLI